MTCGISCVYLARNGQGGGKFGVGSTCIGLEHWDFQEADLYKVEV